MYWSFINELAITDTSFVNLHLIKFGCVTGQSMTLTTHLTAAFLSLTLFPKNDVCVKIFSFDLSSLNEKVNCKTKSVFKYALTPT